MTRTALKSGTPLALRRFSADLARGLGVVPARFVQEMIVGIHRAQSLHLTDIAQSLGEDVELHATLKRLSRNLTKVGLTEFISTALLERAAREVTEDMILVVSCYDLPKQFATRMEYARGNAAASNDDGYYVCDISAVDPASPDHYMPVLSRLWSRHAPDYQSDATEILNAVNQVRSATEGRGVFHCHQATMYTDVLWSLARAPDLRTMVHVDNRDTPFMVDGQLRTISDLASSVELPYGKLMFKMVDPPFASRISGRHDNARAELSLVEELGKLSVQLPDTGKQATLILERTTARHSLSAVNDLYLVTGVAVSTRDDLWTLLQNHFLAIDVSTAAVHHKSRFNQSDVRVLTYNRLRLLNVLLQAVAHYQAHVERTVSIDHAITSKPHPGNHPRDFMVSQNASHRRGSEGQN